MPNCTQAVHLTKQTCHYCLIVKLHPTMCLPKKMIMSSTAGTIAGIAAHSLLPIATYIVCTPPIVNLHIDVVSTRSPTLGHNSDAIQPKYGTVPQIYLDQVMHVDFEFQHLKGRKAW